MSKHLKGPKITLDPRGLKKKLEFLANTFFLIIVKLEIHNILKLQMLNKLQGVPVAQWLEHCISNAKVVGSISREHMY